MVVQIPRATTEGQRNRGSASRSLGGRDVNSSQSNSKRRWIPPSTLRRDALTQDNQNDIIFRKIRGLLNKLTPETFEKLSNELLNVGLNSKTILGGLILLIFQKALDEPKYCSMYAQLCRRLSEEAPNFEKPTHPCSFNKLLIQQCQEEFEKRKNHKESNDNGHSIAEEEDRKQTARRKMVGNLRFIGELGKLQIISKSILYHCIEELLDKSRRSSGDLAEDLECLCQIMKTCGRILDSQEAKNLMEQYFNRITRLSQCPDLSLRTRFMLQDLMDLREAGWRPRKMALIDGPRTITEVREQAAREIGVYIPPPTSVSNHSNYGGGMVSPLSNTMPSFFSQSGMPRTGMEDVFSMPIGGAASLGTGPGVISSNPDQFSHYDDNDSFHHIGGGGSNRGGIDGGYTGGGRGNRQPMQTNYNPTNNYYQNKHFTNSYNRQQNNMNQDSAGGGRGGAGYNNSSSSNGKDLPPRFKKMFVSGPGGGSNSNNGSMMMGPGGSSGGSGNMAGNGMSPGDHHSELSLRPPSSNMSLKPKTPGLLPQSALSYRDGENKQSDRASMMQHHQSLHNPMPLPPNQKPSSMSSAPTMVSLNKDPPLPMKQVPLEKTNKNRKEKGPSREEYMRRVRAIIEKFVQSQQTKTNGESNSKSTSEALTSSVEVAAKAYKDIKLPERLTSDATHALFAAIIKLDESGRESASEILVKLRTDGLVSQDKLWDGLKQVLSEVEASVNDYPRGKGHLAEVLAHLIISKTFQLGELAEIMTAGTHFPLFLIILQNLHKLLGKASLTEIFNESKVNLLNLVPESERTKEQLSDLLEDRQLSFLFPLLRIQTDLSNALKEDPSPHSFFKYIKDTLDVEHHTAPAFISALVTTLMRYITHETTLVKGVDATVNPDKSLAEKEKEMLEKYKPVLQSFLNEKSRLQMIAVYALQVFTYTSSFPKGMLLRWFIYFYDLEIIEEEAFLSWKEDVNDDYPGKGKALFQVNQWLTWLQEAEEDEEEEEEEEVVLVIP